MPLDLFKSVDIDSLFQLNGLFAFNDRPAAVALLRVYSAVKKKTENKRLKINYLHSCKISILSAVLLETFIRIS